MVRGARHKQDQQNKKRVLTACRLNHSSKSEPNLANAIYNKKKKNTNVSITVFNIRNDLVMG